MGSLARQRRKGLIWGDICMNTLCLWAVCVVSLIAPMGVSQGLSAKGSIPESVPMGSIFYNYSYPGINWKALNDPGNDAILRACVGGAASPDLAALKIGDLDERLTRLEKGKLIQRSGGGYSLQFPVVVGEAHARLQAPIRVAAARMVPAVEEMIKEIKTRLPGHEEMLYHFVWSVVMDGDIAWTLLEMQLQRSLQKDAIDLATCWWLYPEHPFSVGTNSYGGSNGLLFITWRRSTPAPDEVGRILGASEDSFLIASARREPIPADKITDRLRSLGLVDAANRSTLFVLDLSSPLVPVLAQCSSRFVRLVATHLDTKEIAQSLGVTPEQTLVIAYHELCYEILGRLSAAGDLPIPQVTKDQPQAMRYLVSFLPVTSPAQWSQLNEMSKEIVRKAMAEERNH
jgi:hypothetical protein